MGEVRPPSRNTQEGRRSRIMASPFFGAIGNRLVYAQCDPPVDSTQCDDYSVNMDGLDTVRIVDRLIATAPIPGSGLISRAIASSTLAPSARRFRQKVSKPTAPLPSYSPPRRMHCPESSPRVPHARSPRLNRSRIPDPSLPFAQLEMTPTAPREDARTVAGVFVTEIIVPGWSTRDRPRSRDTRKRRGLDSLGSRSPIACCLNRS